MGELLIYSVWCGDDPRYAHFARVLEHTARLHNPGADVVVERVKSKIKRKSDAFVAKAERWTDVICAARNEQRLVLLDVDMLVRAPLAPLWDVPFDVAVTERPGRQWLNSGFLAVRVTPLVRRWILPWAHKTRDWCARDRGRDKPRYGDQDALRDMLKMSIARRMKIRRIPCAEWNCEQTSWGQYLDSARIVHVKSDARELLFGEQRTSVNPRAGDVAAMWAKAANDFL